MEIELTKILVPAAAGLIAGAIGSLVAPWVNWGIEKKKMKRKNKQDLILNAREALGKEGLSHNEFMHLATYSRIKPYLSRQAIEAVESGAIVLVTGKNKRHTGTNPFKNKILDELTELEKKWHLI